MSDHVSSIDAAPPQPGTRVNWRNSLCFLAVHLLALLALLPWFFSWTGVALCVASIYVFGVLGVNIAYHRLLTHRGFACPRWLECTLAIFAVCCMEDSPSFWVAVHRKHHHLSDEALDPHSPVRNFFWGYVGWLLVKRDDLDRGDVIATYAKDLADDPFFTWLRKSDRWIFVAFGSWLVYFAAGYLVALATGSTAMQAVQFGASLMVWGALVRTVFVWHQTWTVNAVAHVWGYRNYETDDRSRNVTILGFLCNGEGWHNNHHADPRSARHGHKWWELDTTWLTIRLLMALGLAWNVATPSPGLAEALRARAARRSAA